MYTKCRKQKFSYLNILGKQDYICVIELLSKLCYLNTVPICVQASGTIHFPMEGFTIWEITVACIIKLCAQHRESVLNKLQDLRAITTDLLLYGDFNLWTKQGSFWGSSRIFEGIKRVFIFIYYSHICTFISVMIIYSYFFICSSSCEKAYYNLAWFCLIISIKYCL